MHFFYFLISPRSPAQVTLIQNMISKTKCDFHTNMSQGCISGPKKLFFYVSKKCISLSTAFLRLAKVGLLLHSPGLSKLLHKCSSVREAAVLILSLFVIPKSIWNHFKSPKKKKKTRKKSPPMRVLYPPLYFCQVECWSAPSHGPAVLHRHSKCKKESLDLFQQPDW